MVLDAALLNTKNYKVRIIGTVEQSLRLGVVVIEKGAFMLPSTKIANFTYIYIYIYIYI